MSPVTRSIAPVPRWAISAMAMLMLQIALYVWMAPRGFEFTDESYYFHNFLHWREFTGTVTFFGAYFEWPFRAVAGSIAGMRVLSLLLVLASSALLMHQVLRFSSRITTATDFRHGESIPHATWWHLVAPMASAMLYFGYLTTLRAPSYNLLSLCTMALSTACLLRTVEQQAIGHSSRIAPLLYGVALGACFLSKATTALILVLIHVAFFVSVNRQWQWKRLAELFALISTGFGANLVVLTLEYPGWTRSLVEGIEVLRVRGGYGLADMLNGLRWELQRALIRVGPWLAILGLLFMLARPRLGAAPRKVSLLALAMVGASVVTIASDNQSPLWLFVMAATAFGLWSLERLGASSGRTTRDVRSQLALMALLFVLPLAFSFGTNMPILGHSAIASMFVFCAVYLRLYRLAELGLLGSTTLAGCVLLLCLPALVAQWLALTDVRYTYRQHSALGVQDSPVVLGNRDTMLRVDSQTGKTLSDIAGMFSKAGFTPGQDVLDLSGDGPGVIFAVGAKPLGTPWMLGGYPGSAAAAGRVIEKLDPTVLRNAWLLTSTDNPRRIDGWELLLARRVGTGSHTLAGSVEVATSYTFNDDVRKTISLQLWRPALRATENR